MAESLAAVEAVADQEAEASGRNKITVEPWDYRYYTENVRQARYDLNESEIKPCLQLEKLGEALLCVAGELYGFDFQPVKRDSVPVPHPDVREWEVRRGGEHVGLWCFDPCARQ